MSEAAEASTSPVGTSAEGSTDLGATSTEGTGQDQAASSSAEEPILYSVKVGGKEEKVTFDELTSGYMRQADYTRKTQELGQQRTQLSQVQQLAEALDRDPQGTVRLLATHLGVDLGTARAVAEAVTEGDDDPIVSIQRQIQGLTQQLSAKEQAEQQARQQAARQAEVKAQIESELASLHSSHGDFPDLELIEYARDNNIMNLAAAYRAWQFDALEAQRLAEHNAAVEAKRQAQVIGGGKNMAASTTEPGAANQKLGVRGAFEAALREHGIS